MDPDYHLEWRIRRWVRSLRPSQIAQILSYVPLLITPPLFAIIIAFYLRQSSRYYIAPIEERSVYAVSALNILLSLMVLSAVGGQLMAFLSLLFGAIRGLLPDNSSQLILI